MSRKETVTAELERLVSREVIEGFSNANPTGNELLWQIKDTGGQTHELKTRDAETFILGANVAASALARGRAHKPNPDRDAIEADGFVRVDIAGKDDAEVKKIRNKVFASAYGLGLKGAFKVKKVGDELIGYRTDVEVPADVLEAVKPKTKAGDEEE